MWLADHVHNTRRDLLVIACMLILLAAGAVVVALWLAGFAVTGSGLLVIAFMYLLLGRLPREEATIRADTTRKRTLFVPRMMNVGVYDLHWLGHVIRAVITLVTAPISLSAEAWLLLRKRARLGEVCEEEVACVLAAIVERDGAIDVNELFERFGDGPASDALLQMHDLSPVIWLHDPERVSLTTEAREAIRGS
ncbi:MAG: hypothetical protein M5U25_04130 [Planctomycetota bacterium]|nr:hypothetical protein [Planctomycetota bacterium]